MTALTESRQALVSVLFVGQHEARHAAQLQDIARQFATQAG